MRYLGTTALILTALACSAPAAASADVLVSAPPPSIACGDHIEPGVWYQAYSGGPRWARVSIKTVSGATVASRRVRATTAWRYWSYTPRCGRKYTLRYETSDGNVEFSVRVRA